MEQLLIDTLKQEMQNLRQELELVEQRATALCSTIDQLTNQLSALEQQSAQNAMLAVADEDTEPEIEIELIVNDDEEETDTIPEVEEEPKQELEREQEQEIEPTSEVEELALTKDAPTETSVAETEEELQVEETQAETPVQSTPEYATTAASLLPPIDDIRKAITLGDRFLFQRELFAGDGEKMNKTIDALNKLASLDEALQYIGKKFAWDKESPAYDLFISILKRRFS